MSRVRAAVAAATLLLLLAPAGAVSAAELVDVAGTVRTADGSPAAGVEVTVLVSGSDIVGAATTDAGGAYTVLVEAAIGDTLEIRATGATVRTGPDAEGCTQSTTPIGKVSLVIEALPLGPADVVLDGRIESETCAATGKPKPDPTPPSTDAAAARAAGAEAATGTWLALVLAWLIAAGALVAVRRRA